MGGNIVLQSQLSPDTLSLMYLQMDTLQTEICTKSGLKILDLWSQIFISKTLFWEVNMNMFPIYMETDVASFFLSLY